MKALLALLLLSLAAGANGVITPGDKQSPDPSILSLSDMAVKIVIDDGHATVSTRQVFHNKTDSTLEGTYTLALPGDAAISDFAVWDGVVRIPGVILERKRADQLYEQIRNEAIDPGLLQSGEVTDSRAEGEARRTTAFSAKIVPIPAQGYKRVELEYRQSVPVEQLASAFVFPLKTSETLDHLSVSVTVRSSQALTDFRLTSRIYPLKVSKQDPHEVEASFAADNFRPAEDLAFEYKFQNDANPALTAFRDASTREPGYFEASAILQDPAIAKAKPQAARTVIALFDTSLSMQWEKLERSFQGLEMTLRSLAASDEFNVLVFNSQVSAANPSPVHATPDAVAKALAFVRASQLRGGTNLQNAYAKAFAQTSASGAYIVLFSDGEITEGDLGPGRFDAWFEKAWKALPIASRPHIYALAIGDDANLRLLKRLASHGGLMEDVRSTEPVDFKLRTFIASIGLKPFEDVQLTLSPQSNLDLVYRLGQNSFGGMKTSWVGQYKQPGAATLAVKTLSEGRSESTPTTRISLPANETLHAYLPATWARARVDALLEKIDREGEDTASIEEIIRLSRKYKFITPYTSFLAAPRSLLRPRLIRPGDPVLRVRTDSSVVSVIALFPFGLTQPLRYLKSEDIWQTRFLAPPDMTDGVHTVRLILRDRNGNVYREHKTFVIASQPPVVRARLDKQRARAGDRLSLTVRASQSTKTITAWLYGAEPVSVRWSVNQNTNSGTLVVPASLPPGRYSIHVTAEDVAHNVSHQEVPLEVVP